MFDESEGSKKTIYFFSHMPTKMSFCSSKEHGGSKKKVHFFLNKIIDIDIFNFR